LASPRLEDRLSVACELDRACAEVGFLYIAGEQLDGAFFRRIVARAQAYFALDTDSKMKSYIGRQLFRAFALALGLDELHFDAHLQCPPSQLRLIHYPFDATAEDRPGIGAHTDYECFTLLFATAPGLQIVDKQGQWIDVPLVEGTMIMNIGDMMEILSNGRYLATKHRVKKVSEERYSFALFHACDYDYVVAPVVGGEAPRYAPIKGGEHLFNQTAQTFAYLRRRIASGELVLDGALPIGSFGLNGNAAEPTRSL
jgi:isopenicillin N synthase-like dioxygenase